MGDFHWLQFSDLHLSSTSFDKAYARKALVETLRNLRQTGNLPRDYVFITGDIADRGNYDGTQEFMEALLASLDMDGLPERVFWAVGNHDISRDNRPRRAVIRDIRNGADSAVEFEEAMADMKTRKLLLEEGMADYVEWQKTLLKRSLTREEVLGAHVTYALPDLNLVVLNTCLTSCDDDDEKGLFIKEPGLYSVFEGLDASKPTFVVGHHGREFLEPDSKAVLGHLFDSAGVDLYLCGHSNELGYADFGESSRIIHQIACGGLSAEKTKFSFLHGEYNDLTRSVLVKPYSYEPGSRSWAFDGNLYRRLDGIKPLQLTSQIPASGTKSESPKTNLFNEPKLREVVRNWCGTNLSEKKFDASILPPVQDRQDRIYGNLCEYYGKSFADSRFRLTQVIGEGGTGKTSSLLSLWKELSSTQDAKGPIALYLPLSSNKTSGDIDILDDLYDRYFQDKGIGLSKASDDGQTRSLEVLFNQSYSEAQFLLLFDGFNELAGREQYSQAADQLRAMATWPNVRIVLGSRMKVDSRYGVIDSDYVQLLPLEAPKILEYMERESVDRPVDDVSLEVLANPMMLSIYCETARTMHLLIRESNTYFRFIESFRTLGELIHNYVEFSAAQRFLAPSPLENKRNALALELFCTSWILPYVARHMQENHIFSLDKAELEKLLHAMDFRRELAFFSVAVKCREIGFDPMAIDANGCMEYIENNPPGFFVVEATNGHRTWRFTHQNYRDCLAAQCALNMFGMFVADARCLPLLPQGLLEEDVLRFVGDLARDYMNLDGPICTDDILHKVVRGLANRPSNEIRWPLENILRVWHLSRGYIDGKDLSQLDLKGIALFPFFRGVGKETSFAGSIVSRENFFDEYSPEKGAQCMCMHPFEPFVAVWGKDNYITIWNYVERKLLNETYMELLRDESWLEFTERGDKLLIARSAPYRVNLWEWESEKAPIECRGMEGNNFAEFADLKGNRLLVAADKNIRLWDTDSVTELFSVDAQEDVSEIRMSKDGTAFAATCYWGEIALWSSRDGQRLFNKPGHQKLEGFDDSGNVVFSNADASHWVVHNVHTNISKEVSASGFTQEMSWPIRETADT